MRTKLFALFYAIVCAVTVYLRQGINENPFIFDSFGYHSYLPAVFVYHDLRTLDFYPEVSAKYHSTGDFRWYSVHDQPGGTRLNKYAIGPAVFELPAFLLARAYCGITHYDPDDGFSVPYRFASYADIIFWTCIGIILLGKFLNTLFNKTTAIVTLICISLGTNLYFYAGFFGVMSHPYEFMLFSALLYYTHTWYLTKKIGKLFLIATVLGLIIITRPVDGLAFIIVILWRVYDISSLKERFKLFREQVKPILYSVVFLAAVLLIQMAYWKDVTGHWIYYSYQGEKFDFSDSHVFDGLFSYRKGWFIYTPIAFISTIGFFFLWRKDKSFLPPILLFLSLFIFIVFSWQSWTYGGSYGCRPLIDILPIMALPLASLVEQIYILTKKRNIILKTAFSLLLVSLVSLNIFQSYQANKNIIHYDGMTKEYYWRVFLKTSVTREDENYLLPMYRP